VLRFLSLAISALILGAAPAPGGKCPKAGAGTGWHNTRLVCVKAHGKLVWQTVTKKSDGNTQYASLPPIASFLTKPSNRFLVDVQYISGGHPYKGVRAETPHTGAHVLWDNNDSYWPHGGTAVTDYPAIYAVADGIVDDVTNSFPVPPNTRYGVSIAIARAPDGGTDVFDYSIEPFVLEPSPGFYKKFILVHLGEHVHKGQVIAYMYMVNGPHSGTHIHFQLRDSKSQGFMAPAIFTPAVVQAFHDRWAEFGTDGTTRMPACMGWKLGASENPFGTGAVDVLP
jgi:hypothetical protein